MFGNLILMKMYWVQITSIPRNIRSLLSYENLGFAKVGQMDDLIVF